MAGFLLIALTMLKIAARLHQCNNYIDIMAIWIPTLDDRKGPKYLQIVDAMAEDIRIGKLTAGTRLLPHRELAYQLGISANTTSRAYAEGVKRALLRAEVGRGTYVRSPDTAAPGGELNTLLRSGAESGPVDLSRNLPFPGFAEVYIQDVFASLGSMTGVSALLDYQTKDDLARHLEAGKIWLESCGLQAETGSVLSTMGGQHGLLCSLMALLRPGDLLLTEALTYMPVCALADALGAKTGSVEMDEEGVLPEAFEEACRTSKPKAFYLTPTLQSPTTVTLSDMRRQAIADIAEKYNVFLIEDDVFGPLKTDSPAPLAMKAPDRTFYISSLSKSVAPGLRVGFLSAPHRLMPALRQAVNLSVWMTPPLNLEIATRLILEGTARELSHQQSMLAARRQRLARSVLGEIPYKADPHGFHLWLPLGDEIKADVFRSQCSQMGVLVSEARHFTAHHGKAREAIRICLSHEIEEARVRQGLEKINYLFHETGKRIILDL
ncbi:MAG: PLP-dependent aminotransferase family protein [Sneathiellales bacterium]|nr:PLP-dependent aminotransferase family protein [Sneathiellales bacterium]